MRMKTVMNHSQDGGLLKMISRTDPVISMGAISAYGESTKHSVFQITLGYKFGL